MLVLTPVIRPHPGAGYGPCPVEGCPNKAQLHYNPHRLDVTPYWVCYTHGIVGDATGYCVVLIAD